MNYSTLLLQTDESTKEALRYSKNKRPLLNESQISPNPIKLQKFTFTDDGTTLVINDMTTISQPLSTEYELQFQLSADGFHPTYTVDQIKQSLSNCELITFFGKVLHLAEPTVVSAKNLKLVESTFADTTRQITINLWAELTQEMETGKVYRIGPIQFRGWNGIKKLSTTPNSVITSVSDQEELTNLPIPEPTPDGQQSAIGIPVCPPFTACTQWKPLSVA